MDKEVPLSLNDFEDLDKEINKDKKCNLSKKNLFILIGIIILIIIVITIILILILNNKSNEEKKETPDKEDDKSDEDTSNESEIICNYAINNSLNIQILSQEFDVPKLFDIIIDNEIISFNRYYQFDKKDGETFIELKTETA